MVSKRWLVLGALTCLLAACGSAAPAAPVGASPSGQPASSSPASSGAKPAASASAKPAASVTTFSYGISTPSPETLLAWTAHTKGFDKQNGIDLQFVNAEGGSKGLQVLLSGQLQAMEVGLAPVVIANAQGANFRVVDSHANAIPFVMVGAKDMTPENVAQKLKGQKIGISTFGSESDVSASIYLDKLGLVRDKDVAVVQVGGTAARLAAMTSGGIALAPLLRPDVAKAEAQGFKPLLDLSKASAWVFNAAVVSKPYLDAHRAVELALVKSLVEGNAYARAHPDEAKQILQKELKYTDPKLAEAAYQEFLDVTPADTRPTDAGIKEVLKQVPAVTKGVQVKSTNPSDYVDLSLLDEVSKK